MGCFVVAKFLLTSASRGPSAIAEPLVLYAQLWSLKKISTALVTVINRVLDDGYRLSHLRRSTLVLHTLRLKLLWFDFLPC